MSRPTVAQARVEAQMLAARAPRLYVGALRVRHRGARFRRRIVGPGTDIVIEGFPRSGNSFAHQAFRSAQPDDDLRVATHVHSPAQVREAVRLGLPTLVLIRRPDQCIPSFRALRVQVAQRQGTPVHQVPVTTDLRRYVAFYRSVEPLLDDVVLAPFEQVVSDFGSVVRAVNQRFDTAFVEFAHTPENVDSLLQGRRVHLAPSAERDQLKEDLSDLVTGRRAQRLLDRAEVLYERIIASGGSR